MDGGQFRVPQRTSRGTVSRPEPARRPVEKPQPQADNLPEEAPAKPTPTVRQTRNEPEVKPPKQKKWLKIVIIGVVALLVIIGGWFAWSMIQESKTPGIDSSKYQAVFLVNGDSYFGKLESAGKDYMKLTNIYYVQSPTTTNKDDQQATANQSNVQLIKLGDEIYGPEDAMMISRDQIILYENLKPDSKVSQAIDKYKQQQ